MKQLNGRISLIRSQGRNDCGPCAVASVLSYFRPMPLSLQTVSKEMGLWRIPLVEATMPWGILRALHRFGLTTTGGFMGTLDAIKKHIDLDRPVVVLVRPTDVVELPRFSLHYRVVVGYNDTEKPGDGELYFNCSAASSGSSPLHHGNVSIGYNLFRRQWLTYCSINWYVAAYPRET